MVHESRGESRPPPLPLLPAVGDWEACGDAFFARDHLYDMAWQDVDLEEKM